MYKVVKLFTDLQDNNYRYEVGDEYPRLGLKPSIARIAELSGSNNKQGIPLIEEIKDLAGDEEEIKTEEKSTSVDLPEVKDEEPAQISKKAKKRK
jgi:hypothetical protein